MHIHTYIDNNMTFRFRGFEKKIHQLTNFKNFIQKHYFLDHVWVRENSKPKTFKFKSTFYLENNYAHKCGTILCFSICKERKKISIPEIK